MVLPPLTAMVFSWASHEIALSDEVFLFRHVKCLAILSVGKIPCVPERKIPRLSHVHAYQSIGRPPATVVTAFVSLISSCCEFCVLYDISGFVESWSWLTVWLCMHLDFSSRFRMPFIVIFFVHPLVLPHFPVIFTSPHTLILLDRAAIHRQWRLHNYIATPPTASNHSSCFIVGSGFQSATHVFGAAISVIIAYWQFGLSAAKLLDWIRSLRGCVDAHSDRR